MPPTQRKLIGPETSFSYKLFSKVEKFQISKDQENKSEEPRKIYIKMGVLSQMKGSAYLEIGETKIVAATFGPRELPKLPRKSCLGSIQCEVKYAPFGVEYKNASQTSKREKSYSMALKKALQPAICRNEFTNFQIDIFVYVLQDNGCVLSSAINCAGLALVDGGVPMYDLITASTIGIHNKTIFVDPSNLEEDYCSDGTTDDEYGLTVLSQLESHAQITDCYQIGCLSFNNFQKVNDAALKRNREILQIIKQTLVERIKTNSGVENK